MSLDTLFKYIRDGWIDINSPWFVDEMGDLERDWDAQDMKAIRGGHDDRIMALAIALFCAHVLEARSSKLLAERRMENLVNDDHPTYAQYVPRPYEVDRPGQVLPVHQILGGDIPEYAYSDYDY